MYIGSWKIDDLLTFSCTTHRFDTGNATDADFVPTYRIYEDETGTPILTGSMALLDASNTAGFYSEQITLSAANGFEKGKSYNIYITATVNSISGAINRFFQIEAEVDSNTNSNDSPGIATLATSIANLTTSLSTLTTNLATANSGISTTNTNLATANTNINNANSSLGTLTTNLATANSGITDINSDTNDLISRLTLARAALLDNLSNLDALISSRTKPADTQAAVTLVTTTTNLTNHPNDFTSTMKTSIQTAVAGELDVAGSELSVIPGVTGSLREKLNFIFQYFKLKRTVTATTETMYKDNSSTSLGTSTVSNDGTTAIHGKIS